MNNKIVTLTQGNINNNHICLTTALDLIPKDAIGGKNKLEPAPKKLEVNYLGVSESVTTDVAGDKNIFRERKCVKDFFNLHQLVSGSKVVIEKTGDFTFSIYPYTQK
jgi:hypothetical protein